MTIEMEEVLALRNGKTYELRDSPPDSGEWWAVRAIPAKFPDEGFHAASWYGAEVEQHAIICCQRRPDNGLWQWCHLTPTAKRIFGDLVFDFGGRDRWMYIAEVETTTSSTDCVGKDDENKQH